VTLQSNVIGKENCPAVIHGVQQIFYTLESLEYGQAMIKRHV